MEQIVTIVLISAIAFLAGYLVGSKRANKSVKKAPRSKQSPGKYKDKGPMHSVIE